jgi:hypothetical protein
MAAEPLKRFFCVAAGSKLSSTIHQYQAAAAVGTGAAIVRGNHAAGAAAVLLLLLFH